MQPTRIKQNRRVFIKQSTGAVFSFFIVPRYVLGGSNYVAPSDKITLGFIGTGKQSIGLASRFMGLSDTQVIAACDVDQQKLTRFAEHVQKYYSENREKSDYKTCDTSKAYQDLLARKDIDAVVIASPDHWHAIMAIDAAKAGKDIFCKKPLAHTIEEGRAMVKATRKYNRVFQTGSMQRSSERFRHAVELVRNGYIGDVKTVKVNVGDPPLVDNLPLEDTPNYLDWNLWLGPAPQRGYSSTLAPPISVDVWAQWRNYQHYGGGGVTDWGAHMFDIAQWGLNMDESGPIEIIPPSDRNAKRGMKYLYANGVEMYHEDFGKGWAVQFNGTEGKIEVSRSFLESDVAGLVEKKIGEQAIRVYSSDNHYQDWIDAIKKRTQPICDVEIGHRTATVCTLTNIAYQLGRPLKWNPKKEKFVGDAQANSMRGKQYREGFELE